MIIIMGIDGVGQAVSVHHEQEIISTMQPSALSFL